MANNIIDLHIQYDNASEALESVINRLPTEEGLALLELKDRADQFVREATAAWKQSPGLTIAALSAYYMRGRALYIDGYRIISRNLDSLPPETLAAMARLHAQAQAVDRKISNLTGAEEHRQQMIAAGVELATLALKIGMLAL